MSFRNLLFVLLGSQIILGALLAAPEIRVGVVAPMTGRDADWGKRFLVGVMAAVQQANAEGNVPEGGKLTVEVRDTGGRAANAALEAESLAEETKVAVLLPAPGNEGAARAVALAGRLRKVPVLGPGVIEETRRPPARLVFALRVSLVDEIGELLREAAKRSGGGSLAIVSLNDSTPTGAETLRAARRATAAGAALPRIEMIAPNDLSALRHMPADVVKAKVVVLSLPPIEAAAAITQLRAAGSSSTIIVSSLAPAEWIARTVKGTGGVLASAPLPNYRDERLPMARAYRAALGSNADLDAPSYEGFALVRLYLEGLRRAGGDTGPESFAAALETLDSEWEGLALRYDTGSRQGLSRIWLAQIAADGSLTPLP